MVPDISFDDTLASIAAEDHGAFSILVIDDGSIDPVTARVVAIVPSAFVRRHDEPVGYGAAANLVQQMVSGASFFVFCHDDVALAPDAIRLLARESVRSGSAIVGPKLVGWHDHERLLAVGVGMDRAGNAVPLVEHHERDQGQHDLPREVVATPGAAMLVRADAFAALGGFDAALTSPISFDDRTSGDLDPVSLGPDLGEDLDLCSRARIAGYTLAVEPTARVAHLGAVHGSRRDAREPRAQEARETREHAAAATDGDSPAVKRIAPGRRALRYRERNRIRSLMVTAGNVRLPVIVPVLSAQTIWRIISPAHHDIGWREGRRAWTSALRIQPPLRAQRSVVQRGRRVADRDDVRRLLPIGRVPGPRCEPT